MSTVASQQEGSGLQLNLMDVSEIACRCECQCERGKDASEVNVMQLRELGCREMS